jgi:hypothetical protein
MSRSDRQIRDVVGIVRARGASLDRAYIDHWARQLGVDALWQKALALA